MNVHIYLTLALGIVLLNGCVSRPTQSPLSPDRKDTDQEDGGVGEEREPNLIQMEQFTIATENLRLDYRVSNIFAQDIWVCEDIDGAGRYADHSVVETRIINDTLRIRLRHGNLQQNFMGAQNVWARYRRLPPRQTRSHTIVLPLPARNSSPVFSAEHPRARKKSVTLQRVLLEVGFFSEDLPSLLSQSMEKRWLFPDLTYTPPKSKDPNVAFVPFPWKGTRLFENSAQLTIADVNIPAQVAADVRNWSESYRQEWERKKEGSSI